MCRLLAAAQKLEEQVVVVGYGAQKKKDVTDSISSVKGDDIASLVSPSFAQQLAGRSAGVQIQNTSGILGSAPQIRVNMCKLHFIWYTTTYCDRWCTCHKR